MQQTEFDLQGSTTELQQITLERTKSKWKQKGKHER